MLLVGKFLYILGESVLFVQIDFKYQNYYEKKND